MITKTKWKSFEQALSRHNLKKARSIVTEIICEGSRKIALYKAVRRLALQLGDMDAVMEISPFCGERVTEKDIKKCMESAINKGNLKMAVECMERIGKRERFTKQQLLKLAIANGPHKRELRAAYAHDPSSHDLELTQCLQTALREPDSLVARLYKLCWF